MENLKNKSKHKFNLSSKKPIFTSVLDYKSLDLIQLSTNISIKNSWN